MWALFSPSHSHPSSSDLFARFSLSLIRRSDGHFHREGGLYIHVCERLSSLRGACISSMSVVCCSLRHQSLLRCVESTQRFRSKARPCASAILRSCMDRFFPLVHFVSLQTTERARYFTWLPTRKGLSRVRLIKMKVIF